MIEKYRGKLPRGSTVTVHAAVEADEVTISVIDQGDGLDAEEAKLIFEPMLYPTDRIKEFTYSVAKRRSRNLWPKVVSERLKASGPTTRLADLELQEILTE